MMMTPETRRQGVTLWRLVVTLAWWWRQRHGALGVLGWVGWVGWAVCWVVWWLHTHKKKTRHEKMQNIEKQAWRAECDLWVQGLVFSFSFVFDFFGLNCCTISRNISYETSLFFEPSRGTPWRPLFLSLTFFFGRDFLFFVFIFWKKKSVKNSFLFDFSLFFDLFCFLEKNLCKQKKKTKNMKRNASKKKKKTGKKWKETWKKEDMKKRKKTEKTNQHTQKQNMRKIKTWKYGEKKKKMGLRATCQQKRYRQTPGFYPCGLFRSPKEPWSKRCQGTKRKQWENKKKTSRCGIVALPPKKNSSEMFSPKKMSVSLDLQKCQ